MSKTELVKEIDAVRVTPDLGDRWLTRKEIDAVIEGLSAGDIIEAMGDDETRVKGTKMMGTAFDLAAARQGVSNGTPATQHVRGADFRYLAEAIGKAVNVESPLSEGQKD